MKESNVFQTILIGAFVVLGVLGIIFFATLKKNQGNSPENIGKVEIWGTLDTAVMNEVLKSLDDLLPKNYSGTITYKEISKDTYNDELLEALASGEGPDLFLLEQDDLLRHANKIFEIPYDNFSERKFKDSYIEGAEIFTDRSGIYALPFMVDPLVLYWNRDILTRNNISEVPQNWDEFFTLSPKITKRDPSANILQATIALGEYPNITNAKQIVSALILQADNDIVVRNEKDDPVAVLDAGGENAELQPAVSALRFYTEFSNPIKSVYTWNRSLKASRQSFVSGDLAFYIGFASELSEIRKLNPNLNFDVTLLPQIRDDSTLNTFGNITGIAILKASPNIVGSFRVASLLSSNPILEKLNEVTGLPPVSRQLLANVPGDSIQPIFYESALRSKAWLEPDSEKVDTVFRDMVEAITSGRLSIDRAVIEAQKEIEQQLKQ